MFERFPRSDRCAPAFLATVLLVATLQASSFATADDQQPVIDDAVTKATPNQSIEIDPIVNDSESPQESEVKNEAADHATPASVAGGEANKLENADARDAPTRTLRRRTTGTSVLGRPDAGDTPWYRSGIGALSIVLVVIVGVFVLLRRYVPAMRAPEGDVLKVVARASLSPKQTLSLVQLGRRFVLVAISSGRVDTLCEVNDLDEVAELMMATGGKFPGRSSEFDTQLRSETANYDVSVAGELEEVAELPEKDRGRAVSDLLERLKTLQRTG